MTDSRHAALDVDYEAWTNKNHERAMSYIAAVVVSDPKTVPVASAPGAECQTVIDGKITGSRFIFDHVPSQAATAAAL